MAVINHPKNRGTRIFKRNNKTTQIGDGWWLCATETSQPQWIKHAISYARANRGLHNGRYCVLQEVKHGYTYVQFTHTHTPLSCLTLHPQTTFPSAFHQNNTHKTKPTENNRHRSQSSHYTDHTEKQTATTSQQKHWVWSDCPLAYVCCQPTSKQCCFPDVPTGD